MKQRTRIPRKRATPRNIHPERSGGEHIRVRLRTAAEKAKRRAEIFERAGGRCEEIVDTYFFGKVRCNARATEWSHKKHGARKCDCLSTECSIASCRECHDKRHNAGGKPCPKKVKVSA